LLSLFSVADCLLIVSGNSLFIIDPMNIYNGSEEETKEEMKETSNNSNKREGETKSSSQSNRNNTSNSTSKSNSNRTVGIKEYNVTTLLRRFPDMFLPFFPKGERGYNGTLVRVPFRRRGSKLTNTIVGLNDIRHLLITFERDLSSMMVHGTSVNHVAVTTIGKSAQIAVASIRGQLDVVAKQMGNNTRRRDNNEDDEGSNTIEETNSESMAMEAPLFSCRVRTCKERNEIEENQKWHKNGLSRFFTGGQGTVSMTYELHFDCTGSRWVTTSGTTDSSSTTATMGTETDYHEKETWLVMSNLGTGDTRDLAMSENMNALRTTDDYATGLAPVFGLACRIEGTGKRGKKGTPVIGRFCTGAAVGAPCGLPYM